MLIRELALERGYNAASIGKCVYADVANAEIKPDFSSERGKSPSRSFPRGTRPGENPEVAMDRPSPDPAFPAYSHISFDFAGDASIAVVTESRPT
jgi:hypothetical protein